MLFNSLEFALFLPVVLALYWSLRGHRAQQNLLLLVASYFFYGWWDTRFLFLIAITTLVDFNAALLVERGTTTVQQRLRSIALFVVVYLIVLFPAFWDPGSDIEVAWAALAVTTALCLLVFVAPDLCARMSEATRRRAVMTFSVVVNLGILGFFKYFNFFADTFSQAYFALFGVEPSLVTLSIVLPVGISFYTFQSMSYTIDVYRKQLKPTESVIEFASYLSFFPQLVAGPIERGKNLLPQFQRDRTLDFDRVKEGVWLIGWGLFKKIVVADNMAVIVNLYFNAYDSGQTTDLPVAGGFATMIAVYAFAFQIYADFSAYSDIARGCAKLMGFDLMLNFRIPYISTNPSEFWLRWHISLSSWLRDYLYIPLGGNRHGKFNTYRNLWLTMLLGGLWHGASWTFVAWGFYQGLILVIYRLLGVEDAGSKARGIVKVLHILWFFQLTCLGWLIFRAQNLDTITIFLTSIFTDFRITAEAISAGKDLLFFATPLLLVQAIQLYYRKLYVLPKLHWVANFHIWLVLVFGAIVFSTMFKTEFIYFAF